MSKDTIQDAVKKSLEKYFRDLGEPQPTNVYEMVIATVEKPTLEAVMAHCAQNPTIFLPSHDPDSLARLAGAIPVA